MKPSRIVLLAIALVCAGLAAFLATRGSPPERVVVSETIEEARTQILVARAPIGVGQRLSPDTVEWQDWPEGAVRAEYVTISTMPDAPAQLTGAVARFEFFAGEPIRNEKLAHSDQGYLSAVLSPGMRGVSIEIAAASGAGGFIVPNDRVDVVLTQDGNGVQMSETILQNVKVLAIGTRLGEVGATAGNPDPADPQAQVFVDESIATLELDPNQAEVIINAAERGKLSLALRSVVDFNQASGLAEARPTNKPIRLIRFGTEASVLASMADGQRTAPALEAAAPALIAPQVEPSAPVAVMPPITLE